MSEDDRPSSTVEERISRARERMSMDYDDKPATRSATGNKLAGGSKLMDMFTSFWAVSPVRGVWLTVRPGWAGCWCWALAAGLCWATTRAVFPLWGHPGCHAHQAG